MILAVAIIITISNNNPVEEANRARYESDRANMQAVFTNAIAKVMTHNRAVVSVTAGQVNEVTSGVKVTTGEVVYTVTNAMNIANTNGKVVFDKGESTDTVFYTGKQLPIYAAGETKWYVDSEGIISLEIARVNYGGGEIPFAVEVAENASTYYGEKVTNYKTGNEAIDSQVEWQIFYSDTSSIYLIATDYVHYDLLPTKKVIEESKIERIYALNKVSDYKAYFTNVLSAYNGSEDITDIRLQALNKSYYEYLRTKNAVSENPSMKAVAYMLDTEIWNSFKGSKAEYAIGGPTVEMLMKSYSQKYSAEGIDYRAKAISVDGYQISNDGGTSWEYFYSEMLNMSDTQYVISGEDRKASGMWLASSPAVNTQNVMYAAYVGYVGSCGYNNTYRGFRPVVCLNSNVTLKAVEGGYEIE